MLTNKLVFYFLSFFVVLVSLLSLSSFMKKKNIYIYIYIGVLTQAFAADTVVRLASGTYSHSGRFYLQLFGTTKAPIRIIGPDDGSAVFVQNNPSGANAMEVGES